MFLVFLNLESATVLLSKAAFLDVAIPITKLVIPKTKKNDLSLRATAKFEIYRN